MKRTQRCPKCDGHRLWVIEPLHVPAEVAGGHAMPVVVHQSAPEGPRLFERENPQGRLDLWVCAGCGFAELWARDFDGLRADPARGVHLVDGAAVERGPFR